MLARHNYYAYCFLRKNKKNIFWGYCIHNNGKINENGIHFILFFSAKLYLSQVSYSFALTFFFFQMLIISYKHAELKLKYVLFTLKQQKWII